MWKNFPFYFIYCTALLPLTTASAEWKWGEWICQDTSKIWEATNHTPGNKVSKVYCQYDNTKPSAYLRLMATDSGTSLDLPALEGDLNRLGGYLSLREEVKEWLRRLGIVEETPNRIVVNRRLFVTYAVYPRIPSTGKAYTWQCKSLRGQAAVKRIPLSHETRFDFSEKADQSDKPNGLLTASLPNDFLLRKAIAKSTISDPEKPWWEMQVKGSVIGLAVATLIISPSDGDVEVIVEVFSGRFGTFKDRHDSGYELAVEGALDPFVASRKVVNHSYGDRSSHGGVAPKYLNDNIIFWNRVADLQTLIARGDDVNISIPDPVEGTTTPLHRAVELGWLKMVELLLAKTNLRNKINEPNERKVKRPDGSITGQRPLDLAYIRANGNEDNPMVKLLRKYGAKSSWEDDVGHCRSSRSEHSSSDSDSD